MVVVPKGTPHIHLLTPINPPTGGFFVCSLKSNVTIAATRIRLKDCYIGFKHAMKFESTPLPTRSIRFRIKPSIASIALLITGIFSMSLPFVLQKPSASSELSFSPEQQQRLKKLRLETRRQLSLILTPAQFSQFCTLVREGKDLRQIVSELNLPADKNAKVLAMIQEQPLKVIEILTPAQKSQLQREINIIGNSKMLDI
jgi:hypothetical protein